MRCVLRLWPVLLLLGCAPMAVRGMGPAEVFAIPDRVLAQTLFKQLVEIKTTQEEGTAQASRLAAGWLRAAGFPFGDVQLVGPDRRKLNLVARLRGTGARQPLLLLAHLDVVAAPHEEGEPDPFTLREQGAFFSGRGTSDDKAMAAIWLATLIRMKREGFRPDRDLILALTADKEEGEDNGALWLLENRRELIDAAYCLNEGGAGEMQKGRYLVLQVQRGEKLEVSFELKTTSPGGNAAQPPGPGADNPIYRLAAGLSRLSGYEFPLHMTPLSRAYFAQAAVAASGQLRTDMQAAAWPGPTPPDEQVLARVAAAGRFYDALLRHTCTTTLIQGGHGEGALPVSARATVSCHLLAEDQAAPEDEVQRMLVQVLNDPGIQVEQKRPPRKSPVSPVLPELTTAVEELATKIWPGVVVAPVLAPAATDGLFLRSAGIPTYGVSGLFVEVDEAAEHGRNERLGVRQFHEGREFLYQLVARLSGG